MKPARKRELVGKLPYSLADLQVDAGRLLGLDPKQVLDLCQSLYETSRLITYPRSDCSYLPQGHFAQAPDVLRAITTVDPNLGPFAAEADLRLRSRAWNDAKVTAHHALIPTPRTTIQSSLSANQRNVYELIARRYIAQFFPAFEYEQIQIEVDIVGERFVAKGRAPLVLGWRRVLQPLEEERQAEDDGAPNERAPDSPLPFVDPGHRLSALRVKTVGTCQRE